MLFFLKKFLRQENQTPAEPSLVEKLTKLTKEGKITWRIVQRQDYLPEWEFSRDIINVWEGIRNNVQIRVAQYSSTGELFLHMLGDHNIVWKQKGDRQEMGRLQVSIIEAIPQLKSAFAALDML